MNKYLLLCLAIVIASCSYNFSGVITDPVKGVTDQLRYDDEQVSFQFFLSDSQIGFYLQNKTSKDITIDWNRATYVSFSGLSYRVMHSGVPYRLRSLPQADTVLPPHSSLVDVLIPTSYVYYSEGWKVSSFITKETIGKEFRVYLPLVINGVSTNRQFKIKVGKTI